MSRLRRVVVAAAVAAGGSACVPNSITYDCDVEGWSDEGTITTCWRLQGKSQRAVQWCYDPDSNGTYPMSGPWVAHNGAGSRVGNCYGPGYPANPGNDYIVDRNVDVR
jgi:hypothetical protein